ncbi:type II toxin-antitoxin system PemK/MazF family toxin [Timonella sp. A28]|uniref:type II toxin-antitoxin system PemK/MazF family toxin n=1 Tax=Timonella sp. A28 TaxID=3442640 RepID=UPI003EBA94B1
MTKTKWGKTLQSAARAAFKALGSSSKKTQQSHPGQAPAPKPRPFSRVRPKAKTRSTVPDTPAYPGDFMGIVRPDYSPSLDGDPDPGEIVWTWVPYEEDYTRGKDRPVLLIGSDNTWLLGLMLTSKDHTGSHSSYGEWLDIGSGPWDKQGRDSEVRLDRVIRVNPSQVRREGAIMNKKTFTKVVKAIPTQR